MLRELCDKCHTYFRQIQTHSHVLRKENNNWDQMIIFLELNIDFFLAFQFLPKQDK